MLTRLEMLRAEIDALDAQMIKLFEMRLSVCEQIAAEKQAANLPTRDAQREQAVLADRLSRVRQPAHQPYAEPFLQELIRLCRSYQQAIRKEGE